MKLLEPGATLDGFVVDACIHSGGMAHIYSIHYAATATHGQSDPGFPMAMKVPRMANGDGAENIVGFEVEQQILQSLKGSHVPRFVAAGDLMRVPYLVMEYVQAKPLQHWLDQRRETRQPIDPATIARLGAAVSRGVHSLHQQNVVHHDLKPANVLIRDDGSAVLLDFGLSYHGHYPDLLAEELRKAIGSPVWMAPEQVVGMRGDPRSDIFAIGVMLYELATGELPFGDPQTDGGLRQRLWMDPPPPRRYRPDLPPWLQEVILRCLAPEAVGRYPSAAHLAAELANPEQIRVTERGTRTKGTSWRVHFKRWIKAAGLSYKPSPLPTVQIDEVPIVMVAVPFKGATDATHFSLRTAAQRSLGSRPGARLACVTVISPSETSSTEAAKSEANVHTRYLELLRHWAQGIDTEQHQLSLHVLESGDVAQALLDYARGNHINVIVIGTATHGLALQRIVHTVPMKVAMAAPSTVILVKAELPFSALAKVRVS